MLFRCSCGSEFKTTFDNFKNSNKRSCDKCARENYKLRLTLDDVQNYCHQNIDGYKVLDIKHVFDSKNRSKTKVLMKCPNNNHKSYWTTWTKILIGQRCSDCYHERQKDSSLTWTKDRILQLLKDYNLTLSDNDYKIINSRYKIPCINADGYFVDINVMTLSTGEIPHIFAKNKHANENLDILLAKFNFKLLPNQKWVGIKNKYDVINNEGYKFSVNVDTILRGNQPLTYYHGNPYTIENIKLYCSKNRPDYDIISDKYIGKDKYLTFKYIGNQIDMSEDERYFNVTLERFISQKQEHPIFSQSKGEKAIEKSLINKGAIYERQFSFEDCIDKRVLKFDFAVFNNNNLLLLIEYQGIQHYLPVEYFGGKEKLKDQKKKDEIKRKYCRNNNIKLIEISYLDIANIEEIITHYYYKISDETMKQEYRKIAL